MNTSTLSLIALTGVLAACAPESSAKTPEAPAAPQQITITASDFHFQAPATLPAGMTTIRLVNQGPELHHVQLVRLDGGKTIADVQAWAASHAPLPDWAHFVGGPNTPRPGGQSETTVDLAPGNYVLMCVIPSADGVRHFAKGMMQALTVTPSNASPTGMTADVQMTLSDYAFATPGPVAAGHHTIEVRNIAPQPHEVIMIRLAPGKTVADVLAWMEGGHGSPPGEPVGGTTMLASGEINYVTMDLPAGEYALLCMVPDAADGKPHVAHGMVRQLTAS